MFKCLIDYFKNSGVLCDEKLVCDDLIIVWDSAGFSDRRTIQIFPLSPLALISPHQMQNYRTATPYSITWSTWSVKSKWVGTGTVCRETSTPKDLWIQVCSSLPEMWWSSPVPLSYFRNPGRVGRSDQRYSLSESKAQKRSTTHIDFNGQRFSSSRLDNEAQDQTPCHDLRKNHFYLSGTRLVLNQNENHWEVNELSQ